MPSTTTSARRLLVSAALLAVAAIAPLQTTAAPSEGAAPAAAGYDACGPVRLKGNGTPWTCSFVDNFGGSALNTDRWVVQQTRLTGFRSGKTCYTASPKNISVGDGALHLVAAEGGRFVCKNPVRNFVTRYTGGMVGTRGSFSQAYGRFEVRAKYPTARTAGVHGGFWMYPRAHTYGAWPLSGEIDVAEWWSVDATLVLPSLHYGGRDRDHDSGWGCRVAEASTFHTYAVEWYRTVMRFFIDGQMCWSRSWRPDAPLVAPQPFDRPFSMILNMGVGPATGTNRVSWQTPFPATYVVDHVKAWR